MDLDHEIDLIGVVTPFCLLQMKNALSRLASGELLRVRVRMHDSDLVAAITRLVSHSVDQIVDQEQQGDSISLIIRKG